MLIAHDHRQVRLRSICAHCFACTVRRLFPDIGDFLDANTTKLPVLYRDRAEHVHDAVQAAMRQLPIDWAAVDGRAALMAYQTMLSVVSFGAALEAGRYVRWPVQSQTEAPILFEGPPSRWQRFWRRLNAPLNLRIGA